MKFLARLIYTGLGLGLMPKAPGTFGTLLGVALFHPLAAWGSFRLHLAVLAVVFLAGWPASAQGEKDYGRHDAPQIVIDEVAGYLLTMLPYWFWRWPDWGRISLAAGLGLSAFRLFDIWKPWPVGWVDRRCPGALGVMADDLAAGLYAAFLCGLVFRWLWQ